MDSSADLFAGDDSRADTGAVLLQPIPSADGDADDIADASTLERADKRLANLAAVRAALCCAGADVGGAGADMGGAGADVGGAGADVG